MGKYMVSKIQDYELFVPETCLPLFCMNKFHLPKKDSNTLKKVSKMALKKWKRNFHLEYSDQENKPTLSDISLLWEIFH